MKYFKIMDNIQYPQRWYLGDIVPEQDNWVFSSRRKMDLKALPNDLKVEIYKEGNSMDYTTTEGYLIPVISSTLKKVLEFVKEIQLIPVKIKEGQYFIMVIYDTIDCIDEGRSRFEKYAEGDTIRPELIGSYKAFSPMKIDKERVVGKDIFRPKGYEVAIIVSEKVKEKIEAINPITAKFIEV